MYFLVKTLISALVIATVTKLSQTNGLMGALLKSLPLTSFLVFFFMKYEGRTNQEISQMSWDVLYLVIPSLLLFIVFPLLLDRGMNFYVALSISTLVMCAGYLITFKIIS